MSIGLLAFTLLPRFLHPYLDNFITPLQNLLTHLDNIIMTRKSFPSIGIVKNDSCDSL
jgi:hypothetical protein